MRHKKEIYLSILKAQKEIHKILCSDNLDKYRNVKDKSDHDKKMMEQILSEREPFETISYILEDKRQKLS